MKPVLFLLVLGLSAPVSVMAGPGRDELQTCMAAARAKATSTAAYRNGSIREKQALLRRVEVRQAKAACLKAG